MTITSEMKSRYRGSVTDYPNGYGTGPQTERESQGNRTHFFKTRPENEYDFQTHSQVQNVKSGKIYVFGNGDTTAAKDDEDVQFELKSRNVNTERTTINSNRDQQSDVDLVSRDIQKDETLQSISLKYRCSLSELKRINNLIRDQDFYALKTIKVPIKQNSYLSELIEEENRRSEKNQTHSRNNEPPSSLHQYSANCDYGSESDENQQLLVKTISIRGDMHNCSREATDQFLKRMDIDLEKIRKSCDMRKETLEEVTQALTCQRIYPLQRQKSFFGAADCGMRWWSLLISFLVVGLIMPTVYVIYVKLHKH